MAEGSYIEDFQPSLDAHTIAQMQNFAGRSGAEQFDAHAGFKTHAGFYIDQQGYAAMSGANIEPVNMVANQAFQSSQDHNNMAAIMASMAAGMGHFPPGMNFPLKPEKGLPPTPPGSPDDPKDLQGMQEEGEHNVTHNSDALQQHLLAKPVPMRRLSEKRIAQARASLNSVPSPQMITDPMGIDPSSLAATNVSSTVARAMAVVNPNARRPRSEKKPIPVEQKDNKYFERRKRNNWAAKKSRDTRKAREDEIAIRASFLEKENAILRAQVATLREEANTLRQLLMQKRTRP